jgi:hypothetical protein
MNFLSFRTQRFTFTPRMLALRPPNDNSFILDDFRYHDVLCQWLKTTSLIGNKHGSGS